MKFYVLTFIAYLCLPFLCIAQKTDTYDKLFSFIEKNPSDTLLCRVYDNILLFHNISIDREVTLRQNRQYTDKKTRQMFVTRDSLLKLLGKQYEQPLNISKNTTELENKADALETEIVNRLKTGNEHFLALSVELTRQVHNANQTLASLSCYTKVQAQKGNQDLANQLQDYALHKAARVLKWQQIEQILKENEAVIEFINYRYYVSEKATDTIKYAALVLRKGDKAPHFVSLCTQMALDRLQKTKIDEEYQIQYLYAPRPNSASVSLYNLIWQPIEPLLSGVQKVFYAPSGDLHRVNISALSPSDDVTPLSQKTEFVLINSARSLMTISAPMNDNSQLPKIHIPCMKQITVRPEIVEDLFGNIAFDYYGAIKTRDVVLFGNIYYDMDSLAIKQSINKVVKRAKNIGTKKPFLKRQSTNLGERDDWTILDGTKPEIDALHNLFRESDYKVTLQEGYTASEEAFKELGNRKISPRIIHIATHGYFFSDTTGKKNDQLNRAGLILAGANYAWKTGQPKMGMDDGLLTAFEIGQMNLQNTELVVLSACETGLGYIENNEGVYGLQRAFKRAGVRNLMVSLWSIPDEATQVLMTQFYKNCLKSDKGKGMTLRLALAEAQKWMRAQEAYKNPYYWAAFILLE